MMSRETTNSPHPQPGPRVKPGEGRRVILQWVAIFALALSLAACGKQGAPEPPDPKTDHFPRQYPDPSSL